jgi:hypothetical protein
MMNPGVSSPKTFAEDGLDISGIEVVPGEPSTLSWIPVDANSDRSICLFPSVSGKLTPAQVRTRFAGHLTTAKHLPHRSLTTSAYSRTHELTSETDYEKMAKKLLKSRLTDSCRHYGLRWCLTPDQYKHRPYTTVQGGRYHRRWRRVHGSLSYGRLRGWDFHDTGLLPTPAPPFVAPVSEPALSVHSTKSPAWSTPSAQAKPPLSSCPRKSQRPPPHFASRARLPDHSPAIRFTFLTGIPSG